MKQYFFRGIAFFLLIFLVLPQGVLAEPESSELSEEEVLEDEVKEITDSDTLRFVLDARWGYVHGNPEREKEKKDYSGSIFAGNPENAKIRLVKPLLFERHDTLTSEHNPVSWESLIYGHWDGVMVSVVARASEVITVETAKGSISKTAREWFELGEPEVREFEGHQMLVVKSHRGKHRRYFALIWWGVKDKPHEPDNERDDASAGVDFSGSLTTDSNVFVRIKHALRFEENDHITKRGRREISWTSRITTGRDGISVIFLPSRTVDVESGFTLQFPSLPHPWSKHYTLEELRDGVRDTITIDGEEYIVAVGLKYFPKKLVRVRGTNKLYLIEDNIRKYVPNMEILKEHGFDEEDITEISEDEWATFEEGDPLNYPNGTILEEGGRRYLIVNGVKRLLASEGIFKRIHPRAIQKLRDNQVSDLQEGPAIASDEELPDGTLIRTPDDPAVWLIRGNKRHVFAHRRVFELHRRKDSEVRFVSEDTLRKFEWGPPVEYPDGTLVKAPTDPKVYLLRGGKRYWIETEEDFRGLGYRFSDVIDMPVTELVNYPEGAPLVGDEAQDVEEF